MHSLMIAQLGAQLMLKGSLADLWSLFYTLQIVCYLDYYMIPIPNNAEIFIEQFKSIIEFNILKPEPLIRLVYPDFTLHDFIKGKKAMILNED